MSSYGLTAVPENHFTSYDKAIECRGAAAAAAGINVNNKANFSVTHLLELEELPRENCAMYAGSAHTQGIGAPPGSNREPSSCQMSTTPLPLSPNNTDNTKSGKGPRQYLWEIGLLCWRSSTTETKSWHDVNLAVTDARHWRHGRLSLWQHAVPRVTIKFASWPLSAFRVCWCFCTLLLVSH